MQTTPTAATVALYQDATHNLAYVSGTNGIDIVDVSNPASPVDDGTFGGTRSFTADSRSVEWTISAARTTCSSARPPISTPTIHPPGLLAGQPAQPALVSTTVMPYQFISDMIVEGNTVLVTTAGYYYSSDLDSSINSAVLSIDVSNPAAPTLADVLYNNRGPPAAAIPPSTAARSSTTRSPTSPAHNTGGSTQDGVGRVLVVDYSNPACPQCPGRGGHPRHVPGGGRRRPGRPGAGCRTGRAGTSDLGVNGDLTLSVLDISNPQSPQLIGTTLVTEGHHAAGEAYKVSPCRWATAFLPSARPVNGDPELMLVDPSDPNNIVVTYMPVPALVNEMAVSGNVLYTTSSEG